MPKQPPHLIDRLTDRIGVEIERVSDSMADKVNAELLDDNRELPRAAFLDYWRQNWGDPQWRMTQHQRMGDRAFIDATNEAFGAPKPEPLTRLAREGMARGAVNRTQAAVPEPAPAPEPPGPGY